VKASPSRSCSSRRRPFCASRKWPSSAGCFAFARRCWTARSTRTSARRPSTEIRATASALALQQPVAGHIGAERFRTGGPTGPTYYSPDAAVFFSDAFLDTHCFSVEGHRSDSTLVGLRFEPVRKRKLPDINGVLWLDRASSELRRLEYAYTGLEGWVPVQLIGGWIDFRRLPNGAPLIVAWQIRAPIPLQAGQRRKLYGFKEREGGSSTSLQPMAIR